MKAPDRNRAARVDREDGTSSVARRPRGGAGAGGPSVSRDTWARAWAGVAAVLGSVTSVWGQGEYFLQTIPETPPAGAGLPYTFKKGDFRLLLSPSFTTEWNDNVSASDGGGEDFILRPLLQVDASYPITRNNLFRLDVGVGYDQYLEHSQLSTWRLQSGTALSFDLVVDEFQINLHDRVSYVRNASRRGDIAGNAEQGNLENTAGIQVSRELGKALVSLGFDHQNAFPTADELEYQARSTEIANLRGGVRLRPDLVVGVESPLTFTSYDLPVLNDNNGYGGGVYAEWFLGSTLQVTPRFGYSVYDFRQTSEVLRAEDLDTWYADLTVRHRPREVISYAISVGHEMRLGLQADAITAWYVRPQIRWNITEYASVQPTFFYEHGSQGAGIGVPVDEDYDWFGTGVSVSASLNSRLRASLAYRLTLRSSNIEGRDFEQHVVSLGFTYSFQ